MLEDTYTSREAAASMSPPRKGWVRTMEETESALAGDTNFAVFERARNGLIGFDYPRTLILENDSTACPGVGRPIDIAGRKVVKISILFTSGSSFCEPSGSEMMR
jgi:hypothetical protein